MHRSQGDQRAAEAAPAEVQQRAPRLKERRDSESARLKQALLGLEGGEDSPREPKRKRARRRRRTRAAATPAAIRERCEAILRFLVEGDEPQSVNSIAAALGLGAHTVRTALRLLSEQGKVRRVGTGSGTRYEAVAERSTRPPVPIATGRFQDASSASSRSAPGLRSTNSRRPLGRPVPKCSRRVRRWSAKGRSIRPGATVSSSSSAPPDGRKLHGGDRGPPGQGR